jgi:hypothetical protein
VTKRAPLGMLSPSRNSPVLQRAHAAATSKQLASTSAPTAKTPSKLSRAVLENAAKHYHHGPPSTVKAIRAAKEATVATDEAAPATVEAEPAVAPAVAPATSAAGSASTWSEDSDGAEIKVFVRLRPQTVAEQADPSEVVTVAVGDSGQSVVLTAPEGSHAMRHGKVTESFSFSHVFGPSTTQEGLFAHAIEPLVEALLPSPSESRPTRSSVVFAYGVSNSGKSHTIRGTATMPGIVPNAIKYVAERSGALAADITLSLSMLEVYNDKARDLLDAKSKCQVRHNMEVVRVDGLSQFAIEGLDDALGLIHRAYQNSTTHKTDFNAGSSRGHVITIIDVLDGKGQGTYQMPQSQLVVVDMGGVERIKKTGVVGARLKESIGINTSLMQVVRCLETLKFNQAHPDKKDDIVPTRGSTLTSVLASALSGSQGTGASVAVVLTAAPGAADFDEKTSAFRAMMPAMGIKTGSGKNKTVRKYFVCSFLCLLVLLFAHFFSSLP